MVKRSRRYAVVALERGLTILQTLAGSDRPLGLQEVAARASIPKTTAFRLLATLEGRGFVERSGEGGYRLGLRAIQLGQVAGTGINLRRAAQPVLQRLHHLSEDTVNLAAWHARQIVYLDVIPSTRPLRFVEMPGSIAPVHATALGKTITACLPEAEVTALLREAGMPKFTPYTIVTPRRFLQAIRRVRLRGYAIDRQEKDLGAGCIAAPVFDEHGVVGAISLSAPASRMDARRVLDLVPPLMEACADLSRQLGHRPGAARRAGPRLPVGLARAATARSRA